MMKQELTHTQKLELVPIYGTGILEDDKILCCLNCQYYDFEDSTQQVCSNQNNNQLNDDNVLNEKRWYRMMVTPNFYCNEYKKAEL